MRRRLSAQQGMAMMSVLSVILVLVIVGALILYLSGKEIALSAFRLAGAQSLVIAEGGAVSGRSALMALLNADPIRVAPDDPPIDAAMTPAILDSWYASGTIGSQNPFAIFDYVTLDGQRLTLNATAATSAVMLEVQWGMGTPRFKVRAPTGSPPPNTLGVGTYKATITIARRLAPHPFDALQPQRYIQRLGGAFYEFYYTYTITSDGQMSPQYRRRVVLTHDFSFRVRRQNFAQYALFTNTHTTPSGTAIWFTSRTSFDGPVHTNGEFRFAYFPKFGTPDRGSPCSTSRITATALTSVSRYAWFNNRDNPVRLQRNENVVSGVRRDAPVLPDCSSSVNDDNDNPASNFTRGVAVIPMPSNAFSQQGVAIGRDPADNSAVSNLQVRQAVPELVDNTNSIPAGIYVPVVDADGDGMSDAGEPLAGGVYVQGDLTSLTLSLGGASGNLAVYTFVQGAQTVTVTVDRVSGTTTVTNSAWPSPQTRAFTGVPKGWQTPGSENAMIIYVQGAILSVNGTLEEKEQATIATSGRIDITGHVRYEAPPDIADPNSNPLNVLGLFSSGSDIRITTAAPNNLDLHAVLMAGTTGDSTNSSVNVQNYNSGSSRGTVRLIGGLIEEYYGPFGTFDPDTGAALTGYGRDFGYDRRMGRGFSPPYFPTTAAFELLTSGLAGTRPVWREAAP